MVLNTVSRALPADGLRPEQRLVHRKQRCRCVRCGRTWWRRLNVLETELPPRRR